MDQKRAEQVPASGISLFRFRIATLFSASAGARLVANVNNERHTQRETERKADARMPE